MSKKPEGAPRKGRSGPSGPSGEHTQPRFTLRAKQEEFEEWELAAVRERVPLTAWIRNACNRAARR